MLASLFQSTSQTLFFLSLLFALQLAYWAIARISAKKTKGREDYFLAGKQVKLFPLTMTFLATQVGGGLVLGAAEEAYRFGWVVLLYPLGAVLGLMALSFGVGKKLAGFPVSTVAQLFEHVYKSPVLKKVASLLSVLSLFMILVAQIIASQKFLISLGFTNLFIFVGFWAVVILYTAQGGLKAVISTDVVQATFFSIIFLCCFAFALFSNTQIPAMRLSLIEGFPLSSKLCGWLLMPLLFMLIEQDMAQRCFAAAAPRIVSKASLFAGLGTMVVSLIPIFLGLLANKLSLTPPEGGSVLITALLQLTNPWITALAGCAVLAAIISTATSLINAISSNLLNDFKLSLFQKKENLLFVKSVTCLISLSAIAFAFYLDNIVDVLIQSYELSVSSLFVPIFFALFKKRGNRLAAWAAVICGMLGFFLFRLLNLPVPKEILSLALSFVGYIAGEKVFPYPLAELQHKAAPSGK